MPELGVVGTHIDYSANRGRKNPEHPEKTLQAQERSTTRILSRERHTPDLV